MFLVGYLAVLLSVQFIYCIVQARTVQVMYVDNRNYPGGPWQYFKDRINAIPSTYIFWGIVGLNGAVFVTWNLAWAKYVSALLCMPHSHR